MTELEEYLKLDAEKDKNVVYCECRTCTKRCCVCPRRADCVVKPGCVRS